MYKTYDEDFANAQDRVAWALCQIIDDDAPLRWIRYRGIADCIALNLKLVTNLQELRDELLKRGDQND